MNLIYLDSAAATKPLREVLEAADAVNAEFYANPSASNILGVLTERELRRAGETLASLADVPAEDIVYTSGGTESNNLAVLGACAARARRGRRIVCTAAEHPSVLEVFKRLEGEGFDVTYLKTDSRGYADAEQLERCVTAETVLVSVIHVNNETGTVNDIRALSSLVRNRNPNTLFHSDGVAAFGKYAPVLRYVDMYSFCAHKLHGLKGVGALYVKKGTYLKPLMSGGGHQAGLRPGTENAAGVAAFAAAARLSFEGMRERSAYIAGLKKRLYGGLKPLDGVYVNGDLENGSPYILNLSFTGVKGEVLLNMLSEDGICASTGAACSSRDRKKPSLAALGLGAEREASALRFSFSRLNTPEEIDRVCECLTRRVGMLRGR